MEVTFASAKQFQSLISAVSALVEEGEFFFDEEGMKLRAMDPSQIAMVDLFYPKSAFESYSSSGESIGVNMADLEKVVKRAKAEDRLTIKKGDGRLVLVFKGKTKRTFTLPLMDLGGVMPKEPSIPFDAEVKVYADFLKDSFKDASIVSSHVVLKATKEAFYIEARGDKGEVNIVAEKGEDVIAGLDVKADSRAIFPLGYLNDLISSAESTMIVSLYLKTDAPLKMVYNIGDGRVSYYVAPRIESA